jgi:endo-1,4-beta-D-glucanase Y
MRQQIKNFTKSLVAELKKRRELLLVLFLLLISGIAHGYNMFSFPYYENDEGVYMSQAWAVLTEGHMAPYTYWYDHSPAGWLQIALWTKLTGGFFVFGVSINTGRVFMLVLHVFSTYFLYRLAKKLSGGKSSAGFFAALVFALSPLGIYFQRRVLLDNIMVFWLLLSLFLIYCYPKRLLTIVLCAAAFALACLSKESGVIFLPVMLIVVMTELDRRHRSFGLVLWSMTFITLCSIYPLYALLKGELFPMGSALDAGGNHVSLLGTLIWQTLRDGGSVPSLVRQWAGSDGITIIIGAAFTALIFFIGLIRRNRLYIIASLLSLSYIYYILRGGIVIEFYIIGAIPFLALNIGLLLSYVIERLPRRWLQRGTALVLFGVLSFTFLREAGNVRGSLTERNNLYTANQTASQLDALNWVKTNIPSNKSLVIDNYAYVDLRDSDSVATPFKNSQWYWKVALDPAIRDSLLKNDWQNIDYVMETPQMKNDVNFLGSDTILHDTFNHSKLSKYFWSDGWGVEIWKTYNPKQILEDTWKSYKQRFMQGGKSFDPYSGNKTTSEGQSYALLRAIWTNDRDGFDQALDWTNQNLKLDSSHLFAWNWKQDPQTKKVIKESSSATDADEDIALALLFAYKKTGDQKYLTQAKSIISDIWQYEIVVIRGKPYLAAGNWNSGENYAVINPSYFAPYAYRIFAEVDPAHDWYAVIDTSYDILGRSGRALLDKKSSLGLPPNWLAVKADGKIISASNYGDFSSDYSYDAIRIPWRIALDYEWNQEPRAKSYLETLGFLDQHWKTDKKIFASYSHDGKYFENYEATEAYGGNMGYFVIVDPAASKDIYEQKLLGKYYEDGSNCYWDDPKNYYKQNWAWFGTALYANKLPNLWKE